MLKNLLYLITILVTVSSQRQSFASDLEPDSLIYVKNVSEVKKSVESERPFGLLSSYEFLKIERGLNLVESSKCKQDFGRLLHGLVKGLPWAVASKYGLIDAQISRFQ